MDCWLSRIKKWSPSNIFNSKPLFVCKRQASKSFSFAAEAPSRRILISDSTGEAFLAGLAPFSIPGWIPISENIGRALRASYTARSAVQSIDATIAEERFVEISRSSAENARALDSGWRPACTKYCLSASDAIRISCQDPQFAGPWDNAKSAVRSTSFSGAWAVQPSCSRHFSGTSPGEPSEHEHD